MSQDVHNVDNERNVDEHILVHVHNVSLKLTIQVFRGQRRTCGHYIILSTPTLLLYSRIAVTSRGLEPIYPSSDRLLNAKDT